MKNLLFLLTPRIVKNFLKDLISHYQCKEFRESFRSSVLELRKKHNSIIFIVATPTHSNLGDHAIVFAQLSLLEKIGYKEKTLEINSEEYYSNRSFLKRIISKEDIIIIDGGGNLGVLWPREDTKISEIIKSYSDNKIIIFPQTCFYDSTLESKKRLAYNNKVYSRSRDLTIALRDEKSYDFCRENFSKNIDLILVPDIVLSLKNILKPPHPIRKGVLLCLRADLERVLSDGDQKRLEQALIDKEYAFTYTSTLVDHAVCSKLRNNELMKKWHEFASAELLITDRLHGMIFAIITNTPCLALDNLSGKVSGVYKIIGKVDNVKVCSCIQELIINIDAFYGFELKSQCVDTEKYSKLIKKIKIDD